MDKGRLNDIFNDAAEAVIVFDSQGNSLYINSAAQSLFQYTYAELEAINLLKLIEKEVEEDIRSFMQDDTQHPRHTVEQQAFVLPKNSPPIPAQLLISTIAHRDGNIYMMMVEPLFDTPPVISEEYKLLAESLPEVVSLYNEERRCLYVNPAVREQYGYRQSAYQVMGGIFNLLSNDERSALLKKIEEDRQKSLTNSGYICQVQTSRGESRRVELSLRLIYDEQGQLRRLIVFEKSTQKSQRETSPENVATPTGGQVPMMLLDANWYLTYINEPAASAIGLTSTTKTAFFDLLHADDKEHALSEKEGSIQNGIISSERYLRLRDPSGHSLYRVVFDKFFDEQGQPAYISLRLYAPDRQDNTQLGHSRYLKLLSEHVDEVVCFFRQDYSLDYISPSVKQALGYNSEALAGRSLFDLIHPEDREEARAFLQQAPDNKHHSFSCRFQKADGSYLGLELDLRMLEAPPEDDQMLPFLALLRHVPRLRDMADPVTLFSRLSDHLTDALAVIALPSLRIKGTNRSLLEIFSISEEKLKGEKISFLFGASPEFNELEQALQTSKTSFHQDIRCSLRQNTFWANVAVSFFKKGEEQYAFMRITDISEQKEREEKLQQAQQKAENTLKSREEFLSTMSHEIRTPLNAILGMTHLMLQGQPREDQIKLLQTLKFSGDSLTALINNVLDFSKIDAGKLEFARDDFNLREFLHNIKQTYKNLAQEKGLIFRTLLEEELPEVVNGDVHRLGQVLNNLLNNAIKFTEDGYVILSVYMEADEEDHYVLLFEVADTGIGIPDEKQAVIFDPYQQASERTSQYFGGTGLGLSIVKKLIDLSNGEITLQSEEGRGTTFKIRLRFAKPDESRKPSEASDRSFIHKFQPLDGLKVLYVEDVIPNQFLMEGLCDTWHIELDTALSGLEALEKVKKNHYDLILMDIYMPGMSGFEAAQEIRSMQDPHYSQIPILALSASVSEQTQKQIVEKGMNGYIAKPINPHTLHQKLSQYAPVAKAPVPEEVNDVSWGEEIHLETIHPDTPDFSQLQELYAGDREGYVTILKQIHKLSEESAKMLRQALQQGQKRDFRSSAHKIMSYVRLMRLQGLQELLDKIKGHFDDHSRSPLPATYMLDKHFHHLMGILKEEIQNNS